MLFKKILSMVLLIFCVLPVVLTNSGCEGKEASNLDKTVRTENLSGINYFLANAYNNNRIVFALVTTGSIIVLGLMATYIIGRVLNPKHHLSKEE